jgi:hypothetical protein
MKNNEVYVSDELCQCKTTLDIGVVFEGDVADHVKDLVSVMVSCIRRGT